jgi:signal transduction histidine kinase
MRINCYINRFLVFLFTSILISSIRLNAQTNWRIKSFSDNDGLLQDKINCLYLDNKGFLWIGTDAGLLRYDGSQVKQFSLYSNSTKYTIGRCRSIAQYNDGLIASDDSNTFLINDFSLSYLGKNSTKYKNTSQNLSEKNSFTLNNLFFTAATNTANQIEFSRIANNKRTPTKLFLLEKIPTELTLSKGTIFTCNNKVYLTCNEGLFAISYSKEQYLLALKLIDPSLLKPYTISSLAVTPDEKIILVGTAENKIIQFNKYKLVTSTYKQAPELPKYIIDSMNAKALNYHSSHSANATQEKRIKGAQAFIIDNDDKIWIPSTNGLFVDNKELLSANLNSEPPTSSWNFTKQDGLPSNEFCINERNGYYFNRTNSLLYLPTLKGIVEIDTKSIEQAKGAYPPQITQIIIDNIELTKWPSNLEKFSQISLSVSVPLGIKNKNAQIEYRLMPNDSNWRNVNDGKIFISRMMPGEQTIELRYNNGLTRTDYLYSRQPLFFAPYWYESVWVRIGGILAIMGLITGVYLIREFQLRKQNKKLNIRIEQKTIEVKRQMRKLKAVTQQNEMLIGVLAHDIKSPLRSISTLTTLLGGKLEDTNPEELSSHLREISKTSNKLSQFIGQFLVWYGQRSEKDVHTELVDVKILIEEIIHYALEMNLNRSNKIITSFDSSSLVINSNKQVLSIIIHNLLDNACKYTHQGVITLSAHWKGRELWISCSDTGIGMSAETIELLLKNESRITPIMPESYKLGYVFINGLIKQINARLLIESELEKGSTISIAVKARQS